MRFFLLGRQNQAGLYATRAGIAQLWLWHMTEVLSNDLQAMFGLQKMERFTNKVRMYKNFTPYQDVNNVLSLLLENVKGILKDEFVGMYLYGSLSSGDFNPKSSDIDFLVVTENYLPEAIISQLEKMHKQPWAIHSKRAGELEGAYIPKELIRKHSLNGLPCPSINEGTFNLDTPGSDWIIQRHVVREYGVVIEGPDPKTLIDFVSAEDIRNSILGVLHEWWYPMLEDPAWLRDHDDGYRSFAVITMCRVLHGLEHGTVTSKPKAAQWTRAKVDSKWQLLIDKAIAVSNHEQATIDLEETLGFIRHAKERIDEKRVKQESL
ncbi:MAG: DUF4111 domain-containing protein [Anaerolineae bacterium]|nr:DUF4111 domain-containing protein [Anaerolineae bacterium]